MESSDLAVNLCTGANSQKWSFDTYSDPKFKHWNLLINISICLHAFLLRGPFVMSVTLCVCLDSFICWIFRVTIKNSFIQMYYLNYYYVYVTVCWTIHRYDITTRKKRESLPILRRIPVFDRLKSIKKWLVVEMIFIAYVSD